MILNTENTEFKLETLHVTKRTPLNAKRHNQSGVWSSCDYAQNNMTTVTDRKPRGSNGMPTETHKEEGTLICLSQYKTDEGDKK